MKQNKLATFAKALLSSAIVLFFASCSSSDDNKGGGGGPDKKLVLQVNGETNVLENTSVLFKILENKEEIKDAQLYAGDNLISNPHIFTTEGTYKVVAKKEGYVDSNVVTIKVRNIDTPEPINNAYQHRVILEDFTGVTCGPCARVIRALESLETHTYEGNGYPVDFSNVLVVGVHVDIPNPDPFTVENIAYPLYDVYKTKFNIRGPGYSAPFAVVNGEKQWNYPESANLDQPMQLVKKSSPIGIKINSQLGETSGTVEAEITFATGMNDISYNVYIVEDNVKFRQNGIGENFSHQAVLRAGTQPVKGIEIDLSETDKGSVHKSKKLNFSYDKVNLDNVRVIVIVRDNTSTVLNAQDAKANTTKDYVTVEE